MATSISCANGSATASAPLLDDRICSSSSIWSTSSSVSFRNGMRNGARNGVDNARFSGGASFESLALHSSGNGFFVGCVSVSRFRVFQLRGRSAEKRDGRELPLSVRADTAALVESAGAGAERSSDEESLLSKLLSIVKGTDRGVALGEEAQNEVGDVVQKLERYCIPKPLESPLLFGNWDVAYSSNPTSPGGGYRSWIGRLIFSTREMVQTITSPDLVMNVVRFAMFGFIPGKVTLNGKLQELDEKLVRVDFEPPTLQIGPLKFNYGRASNVRISVIYLNENVRLGRGSRGSVFVFTRL